MTTILTHSPEETAVFATNWISSLVPKKDEATIVGLYGNLGAGKTTFTQSVARALGISEDITSPTFVIEKMYDTKHSVFKKLIHIDAYRLENGRELSTLNFESLVSDTTNLILIEWPENVKEILPEDHYKIYCTFVDQNSREFKVQ